MSWKIRSFLWTEMFFLLFQVHFNVRPCWCSLAGDTMLHQAHLFLDPWWTHAFYFLGVLLELDRVKICGPNIDPWRISLKAFSCAVTESSTKLHLLNIMWNTFSDLVWNNSMTLDFRKMSISYVIFMYSSFLSVKSSHSWFHGIYPSYIKENFVKPSVFEFSAHPLHLDVSQKI